MQWLQARRIRRRGPGAAERPRGNPRPGPRADARSNTTAAARKSGAATGRAIPRRNPLRERQCGSSELAELDRDDDHDAGGREIVAEALWATVTVLHSHNKYDLDSAGGGASCLGETLDQDMHSSDSDPVTNPAAEMVAGALGVAQAAP
jgi:hypothetical protein